MHHIPVLQQEVLDELRCQQGGVFLDCTVGGGGHSRAILEQHPENRVIGLDRDAEALHLAARNLREFGARTTLHHQRFERFEVVLQALYPEYCRDPEQPAGWLDGILFDLGVSSFQIDTPERGFSFQQSGWLDMRMDRQSSAPAAARTAHDVIHTYSEARLADIFFQYGEERFARRIARRIVETRLSRPIETTTQLADLVAQAIPKRFHPRHIHPATRVFQAIRIEVNEELRWLGETLERAAQYVRQAGRLCVISFHSLEDRIVKHTFLKLAKGCQCPPQFPMCVCGKTPSLRIITRKPVEASLAEQQANPRARSAKLRVAEKL